MKKMIIAAVLGISSMAAAQLVPGPHDLTVDQMLCKDAQAYAQQNHMYWKQTSWGPTPIYPVQMWNEVKCGIRQKSVPQFEITRDVHMCVVGYYCMSVGR